MQLNAFLARGRWWGRVACFVHIGPGCCEADAAASGYRDGPPANVACSGQMSSSNVSWHNQLGRQRCSEPGCSPKVQAPCLILARNANFDDSCGRGCRFRASRGTPRRWSLVPTRRIPVINLYPASRRYSTWCCGWWRQPRGCRHSGLTTWITSSEPGCLSRSTAAQHCERQHDLRWTLQLSWSPVFCSKRWHNLSEQAGQSLAFWASQTAQWGGMLCI